jgi:hypothetical protein
MEIAAQKIMDRLNALSDNLDAASGGRGVRRTRFCRTSADPLSDSSNGIGQPIYDVHLVLLRGAILAGALHRKTPTPARPAHKKDRRVEPAPHRF